MGKILGKKSGLAKTLMIREICKKKYRGGRNKALPSVLWIMTKGGNTKRRKENKGTQYVMTLERFVLWRAETTLWRRRLQEKPWKEGLRKCLKGKKGLALRGRDCIPWVEREIQGKEKKGEKGLSPGGVWGGKNQNSG